MSVPQESADSLKLDAYIKQVIETDFPMLQVAKVVDRGLTDGNLVGIIQDNEARVYSFYIEPADPKPVLRRV